MFLHRRLHLVIVLMCFAVCVVGCGEPTDNPEDCTENQFFDEGKELCFNCPALAVPECRGGCGFEISPDERGCPIASCLSAEACSRCAAAEFFSHDTLACETCAGPKQCSGGDLVKTVNADSCHTRCDTDGS